MPFEKPAVVIDNGSYLIKAGFSCDNHPVSMFRSVVGRPQHLKGSYGREYYEVFVGDEAVEHTDDLELSSPIKEGKIVHWDNMERIWHHTFYRELKVAPEDRMVILAVTPTTTMAEKIKICEVYFETLNSPGICIQPHPVLALYGSGLTTGLVVDIGYDSTSVTPCFEGGAMYYAYLTTGFAGAQLSNYISEKLYKRGFDFGSMHSLIAEDIISECCYVSPEGGHDSGETTKTYKLPDGQEIDVSEEARSAELLFNPEPLSAENVIPLHDAVVTSSLKCDAELREEMWAGVAVCGGMAALPGLTQRLGSELTAREPAATLMSSTEAYAVSWLGGATFAALPDAGKMWVMKQQYDDFGEKIIRNKFL